MSISRVIEVSFGGGSIAYAKVDTAYFYNNGIIFKPTDIDLPTSYQVHWADSPQASTTLETIGTAEGAPIPDDLWNRSRVIYGWIYLHPTEDSGITYKEVRIYKNVRAGKPDGTEPTPAEQSTIDQLIGALNSAVEQTGEDVESAEQAKDDAESARDNAQTYANNAQSSAQASARSAESASQSASQASTSATASAQSASQSAQIKSDIEGMVDDAQRYAESALIASQASVTARNTAQGYAQSASASAQSASTSASDALTYANTANTKASEASISASTASTKATEASQSASQALSYKTDAESAKTASQTAQGLAESARDSAISAKEDAEDARDEAQSIVDGISEKVEQIDSNTERIESLEDDRYKPYAVDSASGSIASFVDGADDIPLKSLIVNIDPVQDTSSGDPSPTNICPISGWTGMQLNANGTVIPISWQTEAGTVYGGKLDVLRGILTITMELMDLGTHSNWTYDNTSFAYGFFTANGITKKANGSSNIVCTQYKTIHGGRSALTSNATICPYNTSNSNSICIRDDAYTDVAEFRSAMDGVQMAYELKTPIEIQLTPHEVRSLLGQNNIFADTGDTEVTYRADPTLYIQRLTEPDSDMIADSNITSGQYFMVGNSLYKATANIANGAQIIVGTNAVRKSLSEALNEINA